MTTNEGRIALRVKQPRTLEPEGETSAKFKTWRTAVLNFLGQDMDMDQLNSRQNMDLETGNDMDQDRDTNI